MFFKYEKALIALHLTESKADSYKGSRDDPSWWYLTSFPNTLPLNHHFAPVILTSVSYTPAICPFMGFVLDFSLLARLFPQVSSYMAISFTFFKSLLKCLFLNDIYLTTIILIAIFFPTSQHFISPYNALFFLRVLISFQKSYTFTSLLCLLFPIYSTH